MVAPSRNTLNKSKQIAAFILPFPTELYHKEKREQ